MLVQPSPPTRGVGDTISNYITNKMQGKSLSQAQANLKLALIQAEADTVSNSDLYVMLQDLGLPLEVALRLHELINYTQQVGNKVFSIGKIIVVKIIEFVEAHPNLFMGAALGAAVGSLVNAVPLLGPILAPLATAIAIAFGSIVGHRMDKRMKGEELYEGVIGFTENAIEIARDFFSLLVEIFSAVYQSEFAV